MDRLDEAIDKEVRRLMDAEPAAGLRARVLARIEEPSARRPATRWWLTSAAAVAAIVFAVLLTRSTPQGPEATTPIVASNETVPPVAPQRPQNVPPQGGSTAVIAAGRTPRVAAAVPARDQRLVQASSTGQAMEMVMVAPLPGLEPIGVDAVLPSSMRLSDITIAPVEIEAVRVEAISSTPR